MKENEISAILEKQRALFASGVTLERDYRALALDSLYDAVKEREGDIAAALYADLGKPEGEAYMCETGLLLNNIRYLRRHLGGLMRPKRVRTGLAQFPGHGELRRVPYGTALIMSPWNYPLLLTLEPLAAALAAGNTAVVKPSAYSPATSSVIAGLLGSVFTEDYVCCVTGGREENTALLGQRWDKIFFTGGTKVGREVLRSAAENLTSVTLELGGKSPVIVDDTADIGLAARRIVYGKFLNCGQTCVAPDYVLCDKKVSAALVEELRRETAAQYPDALSDPTYGRMVTRKHFERVRALIDPEKVVCGGGCDEGALRIEPTVMAGVSLDDAVMGEEIFGPVLPILTYEELDEAVAMVESRPRPLALYLFTRSRENKRRVLSRCRFGGGCVNDTIIHLATTEMGFGGVGASGMGAYHGRKSFDTFTHEKSVVHRGAFPDVDARYHPYTEKKEKLVRSLLH